MIRSLFRSRSNRQLIDRLHGEIVAAARAPALYSACGVPDTPEGRFEMIALHAGLVVRRLRQLEPPGQDVAQDLVDTVFDHLDMALREMGIGDLAVPKRMKKLAAAFLGRGAAYHAALEQGGGALAEALDRNVFGSPAQRRPSDASRRLAGYVRAAAAALAALRIDEILAATVHFPDPAVAGEPMP